MASDKQDLLRRHSVQLVACNSAAAMSCDRAEGRTNGVSGVKEKNDDSAKDDGVDRHPSGVAGCRSKPLAVGRRPQNAVDPNTQGFAVDRADSSKPDMLSAFGNRESSAAFPGPEVIRSRLNEAAIRHPVSASRSRVAGHPNNAACCSDAFVNRANAVVGNLWKPAGGSTGAIAQSVQNIPSQAGVSSPSAYDKIAHLMMVDEFRVEELTGAPPAKKVPGSHMPDAIPDAHYPTKEVYGIGEQEWVVGDYVVGPCEVVEEDYVHIINDDPAKLPPQSAENSANITATLFLCRHVIIRPFLFILRVIAWHPFSLRFPLASVSLAFNSKSF